MANIKKEKDENKITLQSKEFEKLPIIANEEKLELQPLCEYYRFDKEKREAVFNVYYKGENGFIHSELRHYEMGDKVVFGLDTEYNYEIAFISDKSGIVVFENGTALKVHQMFGQLPVEEENKQLELTEKE